MIISRRGLLASGAALCALGAPLVSASAAAPLKIRISSPAVDSDWHAKMLYVFKEELEKSAPGEFEVEVHLNGVLFKQGTEPPAMQRGNLDMAMISAFDIAKQIPAWSVFTAGYLLRDPDHQVKVFESDIGKEYFKLVEDEMGIKILTAAYLGTRQVNLRGKKKINTPDDMKGVKLRMPGSDAWQFLGQALGAAPIPMAYTELYTALQSGAIDGQDNPLPSDKAAKFYEVTNQIVLTSHLVDSIFVSMSGKTWAKLSPEQQAKVMAAAKKGREYNDTNRVKDEAELVDFFKAQGLDVYTPDVAAFRKHVQDEYLKSQFAKDWKAGIIDRVNAVK